MHAMLPNFYVEMMGVRNWTYADWTMMLIAYIWIFRLIGECRNVMFPEI